MQPFLLAMAICVIAILLLGLRKHLSDISTVLWRWWQHCGPFNIERTPLYYQNNLMVVSFSDASKRGMTTNIFFGVEDRAMQVMQTMDDEPLTAPSRLGAFGWRLVGATHLANHEYEMAEGSVYVFAFNRRDPYARQAPFPDEIHFG